MRKGEDLEKSQDHNENEKEKIVEKNGSAIYRSNNKFRGKFLFTQMRYSGWVAANIRGRGCGRDDYVA